MNLIIHEKLDPLFETMGLLYVSCHPEQQKKEMIADLDKFGLDGEAFYSKHLKIIEKYTHSFMKHRVMNEHADFFFGNDSDEFFQIMLALLIQNHHWLTELENVAENEIREQLLKMLTDHEDLGNKIPELSAERFSAEDIVSFLSRCPFEEGLKWKLMRMLMHPYAQIDALVGLINANLGAFEKAAQQVDKPLNKLIQAYVQSTRNQTDKQFAKLVETLGQSPAIYPSLIMPLGQILNNKYGYYGLYVNSLPMASNGSTDTLEFLLMRLKALADQSKLQLLSILKQSPKYNLELAEQMELSAPTTSHHMNVLLACGMVGIEKKNGKVYYHLDQNNIKHFIGELEKFFL